MRTFVAVEISCGELIRSVSKFQSEININAKPVDIKNIHFTLQFLGEISQKTLDKVMQSLNSVKFTSFKVHFMGVGVFPNLKFPRIIWIGTDKDGGNLLISLAKKIENTLFPLGFSLDKPFMPHVTIFRIKNKIENIEKELNKFTLHEFGIQEITKFQLKQSILNSRGPIYSNLMEIKSEN
jgi:RNA 2',3'-cyclic 3'-phosphodiesterase